jgi:hypothetical protein
MRTIRIGFLFIAFAFYLLSGTCLAAGQAAMRGAPAHAGDQHSMSFQTLGPFAGYLERLTVTGARNISKERSSDQLSLLERRSDMFKVLSVLEKRISDRELIAKVRHKLPELSEKRLRMIASLSDRMEGSRQEPEHNVAFLLIATLIIFS